ncbi:TraB/GumN family protein [Methylomagnum sp.]
MSSTIPRLLLLSLSVAPALGQAGVYKCLDANNKVFYQDKPCKELTSTGLPPALAKLAPAENRPMLLWKLTQPNRALYLMGSLNYGAADMYPLPESVMDAFTESKVLVVSKELDAGTDPAAAGGFLVAKGSYTDGSSLSNHIKPVTWQKTVELAKSLNLTEESINSLRPWMAALRLKNAALKQARLDDKLSVDKTFVKAGETLKPILELDPLEERIKHYEALTDAEQEQVLIRALYEADLKNEYFKSLVEAWKKGDADALAYSQRHSSDALPKSEKMLQDKNQAQSEAMAEKVAEMVADGRTYFVILDARRLVGEKGIVALLRAKGFQANQL